MNHHTKPGLVAHCVKKLRDAGLHARGTSELDWDRAATQGRPAHIITGGTHVTEENHIRLVHGSFWIETNAPGYVVISEGETPDTPKRTTFGDFLEAVDHVLENWRPPTGWVTPEDGYAFMRCGGALLTVTRIDPDPGQTVFTWRWEAQLGPDVLQVDRDGWWGIKPTEADARKAAEDYLRGHR